MKVTVHRDLDAGTVQVVMDMQISADNDRMSDLAFHTVDAEMEAAKLALAARRTPITE